MSQLIQLSHIPLLLQELASCIDDQPFETLEYGRVVLVETKSLGKSVKLELKQRNKDVLIGVEIKKLRKGDENRNNTAKYLENAKNKALSAVKSDLFYYKEGEIGISEVTVKLACKLPDMVHHLMMARMAENIREIRTKMELQ